MVGVSGTGIQPINTTTGRHRRHKPPGVWALGVWAWITIPEGGSRYIPLSIHICDLPCPDILQMSKSGIFWR